MARPGVVVTQRSTPPPRSAPTDTGVWFVTGLADSGPLIPTLITSMADFERIFGTRQSYSILYDALDVYFREGGARSYVSRIVGPAAVVATKNLLDAGAAISLVVNAIGPGSYGNSLKVGVRAGVGAGTFVIFVQDAGSNEIEASPDLIDNAAAVAWSAGSNYIRVVLGASANDPAVVAAGALAGGTDDRNNITATERQAALDRFTTGYGPGQVSEVGDTTDSAHLRLLAHAGAFSRVAILDAPDTATSGTLTTSAATARAGGGTNPRLGGMFEGWLNAPGIILGTTRVVPPSCFVAAKIAQNDTAGTGVNEPAAGAHGAANYVTSRKQAPWSDSVRQTLNEAGVNVIRSMFNSVRVYGWRSLVDRSTDPDWIDFGNARLFMAISYEAANIGESFIFEKIDGQGKLIAGFGGALAAMLQRYYNNGDLYGATAADAFFVDVGNQVNTTQTIQNNELHAILNVKMSPFSEYVQIEIVKRPISEGVV